MRKILKIAFQLFIILELSNAAIAQVPDFSWIYQLGGTGQQIDITRVILDSKNNVVIAGLINGIAMDIDPGPKTYYLKGKYFLLKMSPDKELLWVKEWDNKYMDWSVSIDLDDEDNIFMCGTHIRTIDLDPSEKEFIVGGSKDSYSGYYIKMDKDGNFLDGQSIGLGLSSFRTIEITVGKEEFYITAYFDRTVELTPSITLTSKGENDPILICYDKEGKYKWHKTYGGQYNEYLFSTCVDKNNDIVSYGYFYYTMTIDGTTINTNVVIAAVIIKWDNKGNLKWAKVLDISPYTVITDSDNNIIITGAFTGSVDVDPSDKIKLIYGVGGADVCVVKLNSDGEYLWARNISVTENDGIGPNSVCTDRANNIYFDCFIKNKQDLILDDSTFYQVPNGANVISLKMDSNGKIESIFHLNNPKVKAASGGSSFQIQSSVISNKGEFYKVGYFEYEMDFDHSANESILKSNGSADYFLLKLITCHPKIETKFVNSIDPILSPKGILLETSGLYIDTFLLKFGCDSIIETNFRRLEKEEVLACITIYPNPFYNDIILKSTCGFHNLHVELYAVDGALVFSKYIHDPNGKIASISQYELPQVNGSYVLRLTSRDEVRVEKMVRM